MEVPEPRPLTSEELEKLVREVVEHPERYPTESKFILILEEWRRQGEAFIDENIVKVVYGEAEEVEVSKFDEGYPHRKGRKVAIVPRTVPVVVLVERIDNTVSPEINSAALYVFTADGWKRVKVY
jgi:hypothetical protein